MLTSNLLRARVQSDSIHPDFIRVDDGELLGLAEMLIAAFQRHIGRPRRELESELKDLLGTGTEFLLQRGLAKLLWDRCDFAPPTDIDPVELRFAVFQLAAKDRLEQNGRLDRESVYRRAAEQFELAENPAEELLYADLKEEQRIQAFKIVKPAWLLKRYNVALAQAVLFRATDLTVRVANQPVARYRELFRRIKFFQLMHRVTGSQKEGYRIELDGPMSLFKSCQKYGLSMAKFLPTLLHMSEWSLSATVLWGKARQPRQFVISHETGLEPFGHLTGQWQPEEMQFLKARFAKLETEWVLTEDAEVLDLGGEGVLVPDYVFVHPPTETRVFLEIFGYWRKGSLETRLKLLKKHGPPNVLLAISDELYVDEETAENLSREIYRFRSIPNAKDLVERLDAIATRAASTNRTETD